MTRVCLSLLAAFLIVIAAAKLAASMTAAAGDEPVDQPWSKDTMQFVAWNEEKWTAWIRDNAFELDPLNSNVWHRHSKENIAFIAWDDEPWQAKIDGDEFLLARRGDWAASVEHSDAIRYRDWSGNKQLRSVADLRRSNTFIR